MIGHLFKLVWNRRRVNALILLELFISFLGLAWVVTMICLFVDDWRAPLGFEYERVWNLELGVTHYMDLDDAEKAEAWTTMEQLDLLLKGMDEIESFSPMAWNVPFSYSTSGYANFIHGKEYFIRDNAVTPEAREALGLELIAGRWLEAGDAALSYAPVVLTRNYAQLLFGDEDPIGKTVTVLSADGVMDDSVGVPRVVGLVETMRQDGVFNAARPAQFSLVKWGAPAHPPNNFVLKLRAGVPAVFEQELLRAIGRIAPGWNPALSHLAQRRDRLLRDVLLPLLLVAAVTVFLVIMVGLGLVGVLWQTVTRRTEEIGLRRALGASAGAIRRQVLGELLALTTVAAGAGTLIYLHFPLLQVFLFPNAGLTVYIQGLTLTLLVIYSFVLVCGLYPSWLATRVQPALALQYE